MPITQKRLPGAIWLGNPHWQTIYPALLRAPLTLFRTRERLPTPDQDFLDLDWYGETGSDVVIILHGLAGSSESQYVTSLQHLLRQQGFASVALNFRGCSGQPNRLARSYHSGDTGDLNIVYRRLRHRFPQAKLSAVGFSLGGNVLLKWLGEQGEQLDLTAAVAVSVPLVLSECADRMDSGFSKFYSAYLLAELRRYIGKKRVFLDAQGLDAEAEKLRNLGDLRRLKSFWQYDDQVTAPLHGFAGVDDYYRRSSSRQFLGRIAVPTLLIQAEDDPFMTRAVLPAPAELAAPVTLELYDRGGHVGFLDGVGRKAPHSWLDKRIAAYLLERHAGSIRL
ncbi:hydrolase [Methylomonas rhizoryzae]|uniref:hydrolase n=1 Tax=Methylomonas rhizoryzae TaxID=2608981 RepID=UPI001E5B79CF|nr:hydrolase [Methylomonas rhizoryzae]